MDQRFFFGWFVVAAAFMVLLLGFGVAYSFASFFDGLEADFAASRGDISLIFSIAGFLYFSLGAVSGPLSDRLGSRPVVAFGIVLIAVGLLASSFAQSLWHIYLSYGVAVGVGIGFSYVPSVGVLQRWFVRRRGFATGLAVAGIGVGTLLAPPFSRFLVETLGWRETFQVLAALTLVLGLLAAWMLHPSPAARGLYPDGDATAVGEGASLSGLALGASLSSRPFVLMFTASTIVSLSLFVPFVHLVKFSVDHGHDESWSILLISLIGVGSMFGRLTLGGVADRYGRYHAVVVMYLGMALVQAWWFLSTDFWALALYAVLFGLSYGGYVALAPALIADYFGAKNVGGILGVLYSGTALGILIGPVVAGFAFDLTGDYALPIAVSASAAFLALAVILMAPSPERWRKSQSTT
ncbi:MAG: MFS transporter [Rhodospirillaceae bacterium]|jgi:MFS family permease|nr:MFS transporter [Rhodospirillaceae bacterium]MBT3490743.1 MFS transporter [Rhodospirillaceae bacterium]MBT3783046.1 MFS transporter [Rhodospirillaceae bacterium]MBT3976347.1 MFS transporter [Rhodospirillaceae bacterium]MBT4564002.1 MFS transporter [Rhodospirillaceae bacterium]